MQITAITACTFSRLGSQKFYFQVDLTTLLLYNPIVFVSLATTSLPPNACKQTKSPYGPAQVGPQLRLCRSPLQVIPMEAHSRTAARCRRRVPCPAGPYLFQLSNDDFMLPWQTKKGNGMEIAQRNARTLSIRLVAKPPSYSLSDGGDCSGVAAGTGLLTRLAQQPPVELFITSASTSGFTPSRWPRSMASAVTICSTPSIRLLHIFATSPAPAGPQWMIRLPMCARNGAAASNASSVPPTRKESVPALAPVTPALRERKEESSQNATG